MLNNMIVIEFCLLSLSHFLWLFMTKNGNNLKKDLSLRGKKMVANIKGLQMCVITSLHLALNVWTVLQFVCSLVPFRWHLSKATFLFRCLDVSLKWFCHFSVVWLWIKHDAFEKSGFLIFKIRILVNFLKWII